MVKKKMITAYSGEHRSRLRGKGLETIDYREYSPGDDYKTVDWKIFARTEKLHVKRYEEEREIIAHILLDTSNSMLYSSDAESKIDYATKSAAGFSYLVAQNNDRIGLFTFSDHLNTRIHSRRGRRQFIRILNALEKIKPQGKTDLKKVVREYMQVTQGKRLIILISDLLLDLDTIRWSLYKLAAKGNDIIVFQILDRGEIFLPFKGEYEILDLETQEKERISLTKKEIDRYTGEVERHIRSINRFCRDVNADYFLTTTDQPIHDVFLEFLGASHG
ncbi:MAG: DUF58 domain-containing protein [Candidatus Hydrothermarchaeota archaeon]